MHVGAATHVGKVRENNEDGYLVRGNLLAVADGMGGHNAGELASGTALAVLRDYPFSAGLLGELVPDETVAVVRAVPHVEMSAELSVARPNLTESDEMGTATADAGGQLLAAVRLAHETLLAMSEADPALAGMGTTLTAALLQPDTIHVAHVGDSRLYIVRDGNLLPVTQDHSVAAELLRAGQIDEEAARRHPLRNAVTRAVGAGTSADLQVDLVSVARQPGDGLLLCTDGLNALVSDSEILTILQEQSDVQKAVDALVALALERGGVDNVTVVLALPEGHEVNR